MNKEKVLSFAYFYLKFRPRTKAEILQYLQKKSKKYHFDEDMIRDVVEQLEHEGHLNDRKFVEMYVHDRTIFKPRSEFLLRRELQKLGIPKELIDEYFAANSIDESSLAYEALSRKKRVYSHLKDEERFKKTVSFLMRKGFSYEVAKTTYRKVYQTGSNP